MRDPKRIDEIMSVITEIWKQYPDTRFNQLIYTIQGEYSNKVYEIVEKTSQNAEKFTKTHNGESLNMFFVEDDGFLQFLKQYRDRVIK